VRKTTVAQLLVLGLVMTLPASASPQAFVEHTIRTDFWWAGTVYATDVDGDEDIDVLGVAGYDDEVLWWENTGTTPVTFIEHTIRSDFHGAHCVYATDLDGDDDTDVLATATEDGDITWWENDGETPPGFTEHTIRDDFTWARWVYATKVDSDNDVDIVGAAYWGAYISWWENIGGTPAAFIEHPIKTGYVGAASVYATDLDRDGDSDILGAAEFMNQITWWENGGGQPPTFTEHTIAADFDGAFSVYAADLDGDEDADVLGAGWSADQFAWWENDGGKPPAFTRHVIASDFDGAYHVYAADLDKDGDIDILGAASLADEVAWWENLGGNPPGFSEHLIRAGFNGARSVFAADVDGDGDNDALGSAGDADVIAWWENVTDNVGPVVSGVSVSPNPVAVGGSTVLSATIDDTETGNSSIAFAEWYVGPDPGQGLGTPMAAVDGALDEPTEDVQANVLASDLGVGVHAIYVRGQDQAGNWSASVETPLIVYVTATVDIDPDTLNLKSNGNWVTAYIELPEGHDVANIDVGTVLLEDTIPAASHPTDVGDHDGDGIPDLMVKFSRADLIAYLKANGLTSGDVELTVTGYVDSVLFEGSDTIRVI
jgi:hypothetical protein